MSRYWLSVAWFAAIFAGNALGATGNLLIFDDADENGFNHNAAICQGGAGYFGGFAYSGTTSLAVSKQNDNNGAGWGGPVVYSTQTDYDGVTFWINSGNNPSAHTSLAVADSNGDLHFAHLEDIYGGALPAATWVNFNISFSSDYFAQANSTPPDSLLYFCVNTHSAAQNDFLYLDEASLTGADIFKSGFEN